MKKSTSKRAKTGSSIQKSPNRRNFIHNNEGFECEKCGKSNPKAAKTCRNHCRFCLFSKHVDLEVPGDRQSSCQGLMEPVAITSDSKKGFQIVHSCTLCGKKIYNKTAEDDDTNAIIRIMNRQNSFYTSEDYQKPSRQKRNH